MKGFGVAVAGPRPFLGVTGARARAGPQFILGLAWNEARPTPGNREPSHKGGIGRDQGPLRQLFFFFFVTFFFSFQPPLYLKEPGPIVKTNRICHDLFVIVF